MHNLDLRVCDKGKFANLLLCNKVKRRVHRDTRDYLYAWYKIGKRNESSKKRRIFRSVPMHFPNLSFKENGELVISERKQSLM